ncbi:nucleoporin Nup120/160-domain-containing protein [Lipomyces arxii]|uniref:nucleoporin Nup120/160-domain-containing protein n=1 Tax=Lipomyces arxii TaxID=56418 RepID=UPI0034CD86E2
MSRDTRKWLRESSIRVDSSSLRSPTTELTAPDPDNGDGFHSSSSRFFKRRQSKVDGLDPEEEYLREHMATASSIYHRSFAGAYPKSLLWRVLNNGHVLTITPIDLVASEEVLVSSTDLHRIVIKLPHPIKPACVTFSEAYDGDSITVDVFTESLTLYSFVFNSRSFTGEWLRRPLTEWCHVQESAHFNLRPPHHMVSLRDGSLIFALQDGGLMKVDRSHPLADDYNERIFSDGSYLASLRGMFLWGSNDKVQGHPNISTSMVVSMIADYSSSILLTASINNTLKLWSLETLTVLSVYDIVNDEQRAQQPTNTKQILSIEQTTLMSLVQVNDNVGYLVTYCPLGEGQFKLWRLDIRSEGPLKATLSDILKQTIGPSIPEDNAIWMVSDFVLEYSARSESLTLWVMLKSNKSSKVRALFGIPTSSHRSKDYAWTSLGSSLIDSWKLFEEEVHEPAENMSDICSRHLFQPGAFSPAILETVLPVYAKHYAHIIETTGSMDLVYDRSIPLRERINKTVNDAVTVPVDDLNDEQRYEAYRADLQQQWARFERLCLELSKQGNEALSLVLDPATSGLTLVKGTSVSFLRDCIGFEYAGIKGDNQRLADPVLMLLQTAHAFKQLLPRPALSEFLGAITECALSPANFSIGDTMEALYMENFYDQVSQPAVDMLNSRLSDIPDLDGALEACFTELLFVTETSKFGRPPLKTRWHLTQTGIELLGNSVYDSAKATYEYVFEILLLLVVFGMDVDVSIVCDHHSYFNKFLKAFGNVAYLKFIASTVLIPPGERQPTSDSDLSDEVNKLVLSQKHNSFLPGGTITQFLYSRFEIQLGCACASEAITGPQGIGKAVEYTMSYESISSGSLACAGAIGAILRAGHVEESRLALPYLPLDGLGSYVRGRVLLEAGEADEASSCFMSSISEMSDNNVSELKAISLHDFFATDKSQSMALIGAGVAQFCSHVGGVFDERQVYNYATLFYELALDVWGGNDAGKDLLYKSVFLSALQGALYDEAYMAMTHLHDVKKRAELLSEFVTILCQSGQSKRLCSYSFLELHSEIESILEKKARDSVDLHGPGLVNYYKILYAWRIEHGNCRDAAAIIYEYVQRLRSGFNGQDWTEFNAYDLDVTQGYLVLLNTLSCMNDNTEAWFLARRVDVADSASKKVKHEAERGIGRSQRVLVRLSDVEREYTNELERMATILGSKL